jgi:signal transduction histidine kinase
MVADRERILIVESNPEIANFLTQHSLKPLGYDVILESDAAAAIQRISHTTPDLLMVNTDLPGLSGKDLLVALQVQGIHLPVIMITEHGMENKVIQAFRLGATDSLFWPFREAEVVSVVEHALQIVRSQREREQSAARLNVINEELQQRLKELSALYTVSKTIVSITDQRILFDRIVQSAVSVTRADAGWLLIHDRNSQAYILVAFRNLPKTLQANLMKPWDDGVSSMVASSGEPLAIYGDPIRKFKIALLGQSAIVLPIKVKKEVVGLLEVVRKTGAPFSMANQKLLEAIADYASIAVVNAQLFHLLEERAQNLQKAVDHAQINSSLNQELLQQVQQNLLVLHQHTTEHLSQLSRNPENLNREQVERLHNIQQNMQQMSILLSTLPPTSPAQTGNIDIQELCQESLARFQPAAAQSLVTLTAKFPSEQIFVAGDWMQVRAALDGLLSNAIKFNLPQGKVRLIVKVEPKNLAHIQIHDTGIGIAAPDLASVFSGEVHPNVLSADLIGGSAVGLPLVRSIIESNGGKIWFESTPGSGSTFHITLPIAD